MFSILKKNPCNDILLLTQNLSLFPHFVTPQGEGWYFTGWLSHKHIYSWSMCTACLIEQEGEGLMPHSLLPLHLTVSFFKGEVCHFLHHQHHQMELQKNNDCFQTGFPLFSIWNQNHTTNPIFWQHSSESSYKWISDSNFYM